ncbi:L-cysteine desulfhydrase [Propionigenium maris DSM 9537]|uniref:Tryptophanase n=1 Tax=Propionigenium maris DSM 9537 TaxID=1123000 RepID=A0A9W6GLG8_9FUSO|nr:tryptophanase [Propionigenium maris]GLI56335.1 L-cysteine desulfhydrase [Propionigenium maris DSM 9537]
MCDYSKMAEAYKIKMVESISLIPKEERERRIVEAGYNQFALRAEDIFIDLLTDSGTGAMSDKQWSALMLGDESYAGSRSFYRLEEAVKGVVGYRYFVPTHQGRGAENVLFPLLIKEGQYVINNMHFDTTKAHVELKGGRAVNMVIQEAYDTQLEHPFKGNVDIEEMERFILEKGRENIAFIMITITCNSAGGQPVSMDNIREVRRVADRYNLKVVFDSARFAENAYFIKRREDEFKDREISSIIREMFSYGDALTMSAKKDAIVNMGGMIAIREDEKLYTQVRAMVVPMEGFPTYGGLSGRDMDAMAVGLVESTDEAYLSTRIGQIEYLADKLIEAGIPIQRPVGGHAVFVDARRFLPHVPFNQFPAQALCVELYREAGVRGVEIGSFLLGRDPDSGQQLESPLELLRLTIPRRVYTNSHMDVVAAALINIYKRRQEIGGYEIVSEPEVLRHFTARLKPVKDR